MSTGISLLRAIRDNPDDDTVRLVYADCIEEAGDAPRADFIRVQVALGRNSEADLARRHLEDREHELLEIHEYDWLGVPPDATGLCEWEFRRGFLHEVAATPGFMRNAGALLFAYHPVRHWRVLSNQLQRNDDLRAAGARDYIGRLEGVDLSGWISTIGELEQFLIESDFAQLRELDLRGQTGLDKLPFVLERTAFREQLKVLRVGDHARAAPRELDPELLAHALSRSRLREVSLSSCMIAAQDLRQFLLAPCCRELSSLDIRDNHLEPDAWDAFRNVRCRLRKLDLSGTPLGAISLAAVLGQEALAELRVLNLSRCGSAMANIQALAESRYWSQAEELRMQGATIPPHSLDPLFASQGPKLLRLLDVSENYFRDAGIHGLCNATWPASLEWLDLRRNYLTDESLRLIASCPNFSRLRTLHLSGNNNYEQEGAAIEDRITDAGVRALGESPYLANLRVLTLSRTEITSAGLKSLVASPCLRLRGLGLEGCRLDADAVHLLAESPALARLEWIDLGGQPSLCGDGLKPLALSDYLSPLCELDIHGCHADDETRTALRERLGHRLGE